MISLEAIPMNPVPKQLSIGWLKAMLDRSVT